MSTTKEESNISGSQKQILSSPEMAHIADQISVEKNIEFSPFNIGFYLCSPNISKKTVSKVTKTSLELKYFSGLDAIIQVSEEVWDFLEYEQKKALVYQNLLRISTSFKSKTQEHSLKIVQTEYATFHRLNDEFGSDWYKTIQEVVSSLYDLSSPEENQVKI